MTQPSDRTHPQPDKQREAKEPASAHKAQSKLHSEQDRDARADSLHAQAKRQLEKHENAAAPQQHPTDITTKDGRHVHINYDKSGKPVSADIRDKANHLLAHLDGDIRVNARNGEVVLKSKPTLPPAHPFENQTVTIHGADGKIQAQHLDSQGRLLAAENFRYVVAGPNNTLRQQLENKFEYMRTGKDGKPTNDPHKIDDSRAVSSVVRDANNQVIDRYTFKDRQHSDQNKPSIHEHISYARNHEQRTKTETHVIYDTTGAKAKQLATTTRTQLLATHESVVDSTTSSGTRQHVKFDGYGRAVELQHSEGKTNYTFTIMGGKVTDAFKNGQPLSGSELDAAKRAAQLSVHSAYALDAFYKPTEHIEPTRKPVHIEKGKEGFNGVLTDRTNGTKYDVKHNEIFDHSGKLIGKFDDKLSSRFNSFEFQGVEDGHRRILRGGPDFKLTNGTMIIPEHGKKVDYVVHMGMLIKKHTGEQAGILVPPQVAGDTMNGGKVIFPNGKSKDLSDFTGAVFKLRVLEQQGKSQHESDIIGGSLGKPDRDANGQIVQNGKGGLINIAAAIRTEQRAIEAAEKREQQHDGGVMHTLMTPISSAAGHEAAQRDAAQRDQQNHQRNIDSLRKFIREGAMDSQRLRMVGYTMQNSEAEPLGGLDSSAARRAHLDKRPQIELEKLPNDPRKISGTVDIVSGKGSNLHLKIDHGTIYGIDGKTKIAQIHDSNGHISMVDPKSGRYVPGHMGDLAGAVWRLDYTNDKGAKQHAEFISLGAQNGVTSAAGLRKRAADELELAKQTYRQSRNDDTKLLLDNATTAQQYLERRLSRILAHGAQGGDLTYLKNASKQLRMTDDDRANNAPQHQELKIPTLSNAKDIAAMEGRARIGNDVYEIHKGKLYKLDHQQDGKVAVAKEPSAQFGPGYTVKFSTGETIQLANQYRVLLDFKLRDGKQHQIMGLGPSRMTDSFGFNDGGLVERKELLAQAHQAFEEARKGNQEYFRSKPYISGWLTGLTGSVQEMEHTMKELQSRIGQDTQTLDQRTAQLFTDGFDTRKLNNNKLDGNIDTAQLMLKNLGLTAADTTSLSRDGQHLQKISNDAFVMAVTTVATAGIGTGFNALANAGKLTRLAAIGAELGTSTLAGGTISTVGRMSQTSDNMRNFQSGMWEGGTMALGSIGSRAFGELKQLQEMRSLAEKLKNGSVTLASLDASKRQMMSSVIGKMVLDGRSDSVIRAAAATFRTADSYVQTVGFAKASSVRDGNPEALSANALMVGTSAMIFSHVVGGGITKTANKIGVRQDSLAEGMLRDMSSAYSNAAAAAVPDAISNAKQKLATERGVPISTISDDMIDWTAVVAEIHQAGTMGALSAPVVSAVVRPITTRLEHLGRALSKQNPEAAHGIKAAQELLPNSGNVSAEELRTLIGNLRHQADTLNAQHRESTAVGYQAAADVLERNLPHDSQPAKAPANAQELHTLLEHELKTRGVKPTDSPADVRSKLRGDPVALALYEAHEQTHLKQDFLNHNQLGDQSVLQDFAGELSKVTGTWGKDLSVHAALQDAQSQKTLNERLQARLNQVQQVANEWADRHHLPRADMHAYTDLGSAAARYTLGSGRVEILRQALFNSQNSAGLIGSTMHEYAHVEQDALIVKRLADRAAVGTELTAEQRATIRQEYEREMAAPLADSFLDRVIEARKGQRLTDAQTKRAEELAVSLRDNKAVGTEYRELANNFNVIQSQLRRLETPHGAEALLHELRSPTGAALRKRLFGSDTIPPVEKLRETLRSRAEIIRREHQQIYETYASQPHEREAIAIGNQARLAAMGRPAASHGGDTHSERGIMEITGNANQRVTVSLKENETRRIILKPNEKGAIPDVVLDAATERLLVEGKAQLQVVNLSSKELPPGLRDPRNFSVREGVIPVEARDMHRPLAAPQETPRAFSPQEFNALTSRVEAHLRQQSETITLQEWHEMLKGMNQQDQALAAEILKHSAANMNRRTVDAQLERVAQQLPALPADKTYTVYVPEGLSDGKALAHLLSKKANVEVHIEVLDPSKQLSPNAIVLDDVTKFSAAQKAALEKIPNLVLADLGGFAKGINMYDVASARLGGVEVVQTKLNNLMQQVKGSALYDASSPKESVELFFAESHEQMKAKTTVSRDPAIERRIKGMDAQNYTPEQMLKAVHDHSSQPMLTKEEMETYLAKVYAKAMHDGASREAALLRASAAGRALEDGMQMHDYSNMLTQLRSVQEQIVADMRRAGQGDHGIILISGTAETQNGELKIGRDGSGYLIEHLVSRAWKGQQPEVMSIDRLIEITKLPPAKQQELLGNKRLVMLDDYRLTGNQQGKTIQALQTQVFSKMKRPKGTPLITDISLAALGDYYLPLHQATDPLIRRDTQRITHDMPPNASLSNGIRVHAVAADHFTTFVDGLEAKGLSKWRLIFADLKLDSGWSRSSVGGTILTPYGMPNNNPEFMLSAAGAGFNMPERYPGRYSFPVVTPSDRTFLRPQTEAHVQSVEPHELHPQSAIDHLTQTMRDSGVELSLESRDALQQLDLPAGFWNKYNRDLAELLAKAPTEQHKPILEDIELAIKSHNQEELIEAVYLARRDKPNVSILPAARVQETVEHILAEANQTTDAEYAIALREFAARVQAGKIILTDGDIESRGNGRTTPLNPIKRGAICSATASALAANKRYSPKRILQELLSAKPTHTDENIDTAVEYVPIKNGMPQLTGEHIMSLHGDATGASKGSEVGENYPVDATGLKITRYADTFDQNTPNGLFLLRKVLAHPTKTGYHVYTAEVKDGEVTVYDPNDGEVSQYNLRDSNDLHKLNAQLSPSGARRNQEVGIWHVP